jgi:cellulose synthase/poly-beta-1,6-N-acetylglucosamine synthase-like glycosyltransferase
VIRRRLARALDRRFESLHHRVERLAQDVAGVEEQLRAVTALLDTELFPALRLLAGRDAESRRLLAEARADPEYSLAFDDPDPLVTVVLPTYGRAELLRARALPAVLGQTHARLEVLVVGDGPDDAAEAVVREAGDERVRWTRISQRYVYPDEHRHWLAATTLTRNEGYRLATGRWLFDFDDDDSLPADAIESLLAAARETRAEAVQGTAYVHAPDGSTEVVAVTLPDRLPFKGAIVHSHLRFFEREHVASALGVPGDSFRGERMLRAGVRIELIDHVTYDYYPSSLWG